MPINNVPKYKAEVCDIGTDIDLNFDETLLKVKKTMDDGKISFSCLKEPMMLEILFKLLPYEAAKKIETKSFYNPPIALTNIGLIDKNQLIFGNAELKDAYINGSIKYNPYFQVAVTTFNNVIFLSKFI